MKPVSFNTPKSITTYYSLVRKKKKKTSSAVVKHTHQAVFHLITFAYVENVIPNVCFSVTTLQRSVLLVN